MAERHDLIIDQGADFFVEIDLFDSNGDPDTTAYTAAGQFRKSYMSNTAIDLSCNVDSGILTVSLSANTSSNVTPGRYVYDVELTNPSDNTVTRIIEGIVTLTPSATR